jgi:DNA polymerase-3 subunit gamma/tau
MAYQALARKWRPQTLDDVLGQQAVTRTLRNALKSKRIAQAFVFAGPRAGWARPPPPASSPGR